MRRKTALIIPTLNAASCWTALVNGIKQQAICPNEVLIIDSSSTDGTERLARSEGFRVLEIPPSAFNHGGTRQLSTIFFEGFDFYVFMTQDAVLRSSTDLESLIKAFDDSSIGAAFGRQIPRDGATHIEAHARIYNYPDQPRVAGFTDRSLLGFKTVFISNSFAAYRRTALESVNGFPNNVIFGEDTVVAARLLKTGWRIAYVPHATVTHSHSLSVAEEFRRYFDIGVLHAREARLFSEFGTAGGEGARFVRSEVKYLWRNNAAEIPIALLRTALKYLAYRLGCNEHKLARRVKQKLSMNRGFWKTAENAS